MLEPIGQIEVVLRTDHVEKIIGSFYNASEYNSTW